MSFSTPVIFIIFRRPDLTARVFDVIRNIRPKKLLVIADGPRNCEEAELCQQARAITEKIDWDCQVLRQYSKVNLGCRHRVNSGLDWAFSQVEEAIVLEDDCLPHPSFFGYCQKLLEHYRSNEQVWCISGDNFQDGYRWGDGSYYLSNYNHCWGWATWSRNWQQCDQDLSDWPEFRNSKRLSEILEDSVAIDYWESLLERFYRLKEPDTWDYAWTFTCWLNDGLTALPNVNLVSNIGFGACATHTVSKSRFANLPTESMRDFCHPSSLFRNKEADLYTFENFIYKAKPENKATRLKNKVRLLHSNIVSFLGAGV